MAKKSGTAIRDFFISLGFDASDVQKGFKQIEREFSKLQKTLNGSMSANIKVQNQQNKAQKESVKQSKAKVTSEKQLYTLEKARAELKRKIAYIEKQEKALGAYVPGYYNDQKNAARSKNLDRIKMESDKLNETYKGYKKLEQELAKQERERAKAAERANKAQIRADKARIKEQQRLEKQSLDSLNRQRQAAYRDNLKALNRQRRLAIRQQMIEDRREAAGSRVSRITRRADWMIRRQGGAAAGLSNTAEYKNYNDQLNTVRQMKGTANSASDFRRLNSAMADLNLSYNQLIVKNRELQREFRATGFTAKALQDSLRNLARSYVSVFAIIGGSGMAASTGQDLVALRTTLLAATGSAEEAGKAFEFVRSQALGMGLDLQSSVKGFAQMGVAAKMAGLSAGQTQEIFTGLAEASAAFGMSTVDQERAQRAIVQMMS